MSIWHYSRNSLATYILDGMSHDLLDRVTIFAPRKRGKTEFIVMDVMPLCYERDILPIYVDFWKIKNDPTSAFISAVEDAISENQTWFQGVLSKFHNGNGKVELTPTKLSASLSADTKKTEATLLDAFKMLDKCDKPVLLLLDEVQHLATKPDFMNFTASLRSFMVNRHDQKIKGIFTGSSQSGLSRLFNDSKAPFYNSNQTLTFFELKEDFVEFEIGVFNKITGGRTLDLEDSIKCFKAQGRSPGRFVEVLKAMALNGIYDINEGVQEFDSDLVEQQNNIHSKLVASLKPLDLTLLRLIAIGEGKGFYTERGAQKISAMTKDKVPTGRTSISNSINRLSKAGLIFSHKKGAWLLEDPTLRDYLIEANFT